MFLAIQPVHTFVVSPCSIQLRNLPTEMRGIWSASGREDFGIKVQNLEKGGEGAALLSILLSS